MNVAVARLTALRRHLSGINPHSFHMGAFNTPLDCGTRMCIAGHMADMPEFKALGYKLVPSEYIGCPLVPSIFPLGIKESIALALGISIEDVIALCYHYDLVRGMHGADAIERKLQQIDDLIEKYRDASISTAPTELIAEAA